MPFILVHVLQYCLMTVESLNFHCSQSLPQRKCRSNLYPLHTPSTFPKHISPSFHLRPSSSLSPTLEPHQKKLRLSLTQPHPKTYNLPHITLIPPQLQLPLPRKTTRPYKPHRTNLKRPTSTVSNPQSLSPKLFVKSALNPTPK